MQRSESHYDAIVVGAGIGGLISARELSQAGLRTLLVEARDHVGGRTNTVDFAGERIETGGTYFDLDREPEMRKEFERYALPIRYTKDEVAFRTLLNGKVYTSPFPFEQVDDLIRVAYKAIQDSHRIDIEDPNWALGKDDLDIPFSEWLAQFGELPRETWEYVNAWISIYAGNLPSEVSALAIIGPYIAGLGHSPWGWYAGVSYEIDGGSDKYRQAVLADCPGMTLKLDTPVAKIEQTDELVTITARSGETFTADYAVLAAPVNTWSNIEFTPGLSEMKAEAASVKHIGKHQKLWMHVRNVPAGIYGISYESPFKMLIHHTVLDNGETLIFAMTEHTQLDIDDKDAVQEALRKIVPEADLLDTYYEDWLGNEFSNGTWMVAQPGFLTKYPVLDQPEGRLYFAGADVNKRWESWMVGGLYSGKKAAAAIVENRGN